MGLKPIVMLLVLLGLALAQDLPSQWTRIVSGGQTRCARDTPFAFWVKGGSVNKLLVFFQGGGGCWSAETCQVGSSFFKDDVLDDPRWMSGIFDLNNPENPFRNHHLLYIPSCTGDVYVGSNVQTYQGPNGQKVVIHHKGFINAQSALSYVYPKVREPESVFVAGCSAGSVGSIFHMPYIAQQYPRARVAQLGDSLAFVFHRPLNLQTDYRAHDNFPGWIGELAKMPPGQFTTAGLYSAIARYYPQHSFAQYNTAHDAVQQRYYYALSGVTGRWEDALEASHRQIAAQAPNFRSYLASGSNHCILHLPRFYSERSAGLRLRNWVSDLANHKAVQSVRCRECQ